MISDGSGDRSVAIITVDGEYQDMMHRLKIGVNPMKTYPLLFVNSSWLFQNKVVPLHPIMSHETGGGSESGALLGNL